MAEDAAVPPLVAAATLRAREAGFPYSCEPATGRLLVVLTAHLPAGARVLELGTGTGVGTAWIASGLLPRTDVEVISVEADPQRAELAARGDWPAFVGFRRGDALDLLARAGRPTSSSLTLPQVNGTDWTRRSLRSARTAC